MQIDVEVKKYFCKAGVKGMQVGGCQGPPYRVHPKFRGLWEEQSRLGSTGGHGVSSGEDFCLLALLALAPWRSAGDS